MEGEAQNETHPCERVFGTCKDGSECKYKNAPRQGCVTFLKGRCRFGSRCKEPHFLLHENQYIPALHPCVRIFGACKFGEACESANLPSTTCLKFVHGKCTFGDRCKELHPSGIFPNAAVMPAFQQQQFMQQQYLNQAMQSPLFMQSAGMKRGREADLFQQQRQPRQFQQQPRQFYQPDPQQANRPTSLSGNLHPCVRVFGRCAGGQKCAFVNIPSEACVRFLKGECKFGEQCQEVHLDIGKNGRHPCARIFGYCRPGCRYQDYPAESCLQFLKGKCKFGEACKELHSRATTEAAAV